MFYRKIADREAVNRVRGEYFGSTRPASTAVEVSRLVKDDLLVEIEVIAVLPLPAETLAYRPRTSEITRSAALAPVFEPPAAAAQGSQCSAARTSAR